MPYDPKSCSLLRPANLHELPPEERPDKEFFSPLICESLRQLPTENARRAREAARCAELSRLAYLKFENKPEGEQELGVALARFKMSCIEIINEAGTQGFVAEAEDSYIIVFRGTESVDTTAFKSLAHLRPAEANRRQSSKADVGRASADTSVMSRAANLGQAVLDLLTDLRFHKTAWQYGAGNVHAGFEAAFQCFGAIWQEKLSAKVGTGDKAILVCGHSLGAALATLAAAFLLKENRQVSLYTFGSPRVGDKAFVASVAELYHERYIDCSDMVTHLAPFAFFGYRHCGNAHYVSATGELLRSPECAEVFTDQVRAFFSYFWQYFKPFGKNRTAGWRGLADHAPINYVSALLQLR